MKRPAVWLSRGEAGDTYIELLIAVVIISLAVVAILGAITSTITASAEHRSLSNDDTLAKSALESAKNQLQLQASPKFENCGTTAGSGAQAVLTDYTNKAGLHYVDLTSINTGAPSGYSVALTGIQCWQQAVIGGNNVGQLDSSCTFSRTANSQGGCAADDVTGLQLITVTATDPAGMNVDLSTLVRDPTHGNAYATLPW